MKGWSLGSARAGSLCRVVACRRCCCPCRAQWSGRQRTRGRERRVECRQRGTQAEGMGSWRVSQVENSLAPERYARVLHEHEQRCSLVRGPREVRWGRGRRLFCSEGGDPQRIDWYEQERASMPALAPTLPPPHRPRTARTTAVSRRTQERRERPEPSLIPRPAPPHPPRFVPASERIILHSSCWACPEVRLVGSASRQLGIHTWEGRGTVWARDLHR